MALLSAMQRQAGMVDQEKPKPKPQTGIATYKGGIEKTPTGKSNAFEDNLEKMSEEELIQNAKKLGFRTDSNENLQEDLFNYMAEKNPEKLKEVMKTFGKTKAGSRVYKGVEVPVSDKLIGARTTLAMKKAISDDNKKKDEEIEIKDFKYKDKPMGESLYDKSGALVGSYKFKVKSRPETKSERFIFNTPTTGTSKISQQQGEYDIPNEQLERFTNLIKSGASKYSDNPSTMSSEELEKYRVIKPKQ
jgi:hypothetical protein